MLTKSGSAESSPKNEKEPNKDIINPENNPATSDTSIPSPPNLLKLNIAPSFVISGRIIININPAPARPATTLILSNFLFFIISIGNKNAINNPKSPNVY